MHQSWWSCNNLQKCKEGHSMHHTNDYGMKGCGIVLSAVCLKCLSSVSE